MDEELIKLEKLKLNMFKYKIIYYKICLEQEMEFSINYLIKNIL
jgi:hypothetical protein